MSVTSAQLQAGLKSIFVVADTVREAGRAPRGVIMAGMGVDLSTYESMERLLLSTGLVSRDGQELVWVG